MADHDMTTTKKSQTYVHPVRQFTLTKSMPGQRVNLVWVFTWLESSPVQLFKEFTCSESSPHLRVHLFREFTWLEIHLVRKRTWLERPQNNACFECSSFELLSV